MQRSKGIILGILFASLFLPTLIVFPVNQVSAQSPRGYECDIFALGKASKAITMTPAVNRTKVGENEQFTVQVVMAFNGDKDSQEVAKECEKKQGKYDFQLYLYIDKTIGTTYYRPGIRIDAKFYSPKEGGPTEYGFAGEKTLSIVDLRGPKDIVNSQIVDDYKGKIYAYVWDADAASAGSIWSVYTTIPLQYGKDPVSETPTQLPPLPGNIKADTSDGTSGGLKDASQSEFKVTSGLRDKYRVLLSEKSPFDKLIFGKNGLAAINLDWKDDKSKLQPDNQVKIPDKNYQIGSNPYYKYTWLGFNYFDTKIDKDGCESGYLTESCSKVIFSDGNKNGKESKEQASLPANFDPAIYNASWSAKITDKEVAEGTPLGTVEYRVIPIVWARSGIVKGDWYSYVYGSTPIKVTLEVYKTEADIKKACENDAEVTDKSICSDPAKMRYEVGKVVEATTGTDQKSGDLASDLFNFIAKIIAYIVLLITSFVYWVFAFILVPVLVALTGVHPYKDTFVNFIYPGWIIIRNISNIVFIVALLYMGLKILFQQEDSAKSRGFIITLILMALLVNFSLAIGQSIVAIADTVQAQFLPADSKVIESLAQKLMTEPIKTFRGGDDSLTSTGNFDVDKSASDIPKAIVLLVLALAAFFCFVALIAFMFVRLVALWILFMLSPLAYVGRILPETKTYANKWWTEFIRYSFNVPIMVFFLNIAALIAVTFSQQSGDQVQTAAADGKLLGSTAKELTEFALTIVSHFVVLIFIFIGMKFAQKFGGVGAEKIVGFAKKGFDAVTKKPAQWAGGAIKNMAKEGYERRIAGGLMDPKAWKQGWKDRIAKTTDRKKTARLLKKDGRLNPEIATQNIGKSLKYLFHKATGGAPHRLLNEADSLKEQAGILTQGERLGKEDRLATDSSVKDIYDNFSRQIPETGPINTAATLADIDTRINDFQNQGILKADALEVEANNLEATGNISGAEAKRLERDSVLDEYQDRALALNAIRDKLDPAVNGGVDVNSDPGLRKEIASALAKEVKEFEKSIKDTETRLTQNDTAKAKYGVTGDMPADERKRLMDQAEKLEQKASERKLPESMAIKALLREGQKKEMEKYDGIDDPDELIAIHKKAMKDNNLLLATAIQKKLAKEGFFKDLLQDGGKKNNIESMQSFFAENLKGMAPNLRMQVMSEVSFLNKQNGNLALANATKIDPNTGALRASTLDEQAKKVNGFLESRNPNDLKNLKGDQIVREREDGKNEMFEGYITGMRKHMESLTNLEFDKFVPGIPTAVAKKVVNSVNFGSFNPQNTPIGNRTQGAFRRRAGV